MWLLLLSLLSASLGAACPEWMDSPSVPPCPSPGQNLLPETFPIAAHIVGDKAAFGSIPEDHPQRQALEAEVARVGPSFLTAYVEQVLRQSGERTPLVFLPVRPENFDAVVKHVKEMPGADEATRGRWLASLVKVEIPLGIHGDEATWHRDGLKTLVKGSTGGVEVRRINDHPGTFRLSVTLAEAMEKACPRMARGKDIALPKGDDPEPSDLPFGEDVKLSPTFGGNSIGLPGGFCAHGSNQDPSVVAQTCPAEATALPVEVDWLYVGHLDEILSVVKTSGSAPCDFALVMPSPRRAKTLLESHPEMAFFEDLGAQGPLAQWYRESPPLKELCDRVEKARKSGEGSPNAGEHGAWWNAWVSVALAAEGRCDKLLNRDVLTLWEKDAEFRTFQERVQEKLDAVRTQVVGRLKEKLGCEPRVVESANLFHGNLLGEPPNQSLAPESAKTILPNAANLVAVDRAALAPHPRNKAFEADFASEFKEVGVRATFVDTWDYAHRSGGGNLHCATLTVPYCRKGAP